MLQQPGSRTREGKSRVELDCAVDPSSPKPKQDLPQDCAVACDQYNPAEYRFANSVSSCSLHPPNFADGIRIRTEGQTDGRHCCYLLPIRLQGPEVNDSRAVSSGAADLELNPLALALLLRFVTHLLHFCAADHSLTTRYLPTLHAASQQPQSF